MSRHKNQQLLDKILDYGYTEQDLLSYYFSDWSTVNDGKEMLVSFLDELEAEGNRSTRMLARTLSNNVSRSDLVVCYETLVDVGLSQSLMVHLRSWLDAHDEHLFYEDYVKYELGIDPEEAF